MYALVTGASRGIGKSITKALLKEDGRVLGTARSSAFPSEFSQHDRFEGLHVDLADQVAIEQKLKPIFDRDEAPNVLVNNAGIFEDADLEDDDESWLQNWDDTMQVNLRAPALLSKWAVNRWLKEDGGHLINVASRAAYRGDTQEYASYAASKGKRFRQARCFGLLHCTGLH